MRLARLWGNWDRFWFSATDLRQIGLFRMLFFSLLFIMYSFRQFEVDFFFTAAGLVDSAQSVAMLPEYYRPFIYWAPTTATAAKIMHSSYLVLLLLLALGVCGRSLTWLALMLHLAFLQRNPAVLYGADIIAGIFMLSLALMNSHQHYTVRNFWRKSTDLSVLSNDILTPVGVRLLQIQICVIYGYSGIEKLKGGSWWDGSALWQLLGNTQITTIDFGFVKSFPTLLSLLVLSTVLFEIYFPALIWLKRWRYPMLWMGVAFHLGILAVLGLPFFSLVMILGYLMFLRQDEFPAKYFYHLSR